MSGIAGVVYADGRPVAPETLAALRDTLCHVTPDRSAQWTNGPVGLAQVTLWTTPESRSEAFPLIDARSSLALVADARLDNRDELISLLGLGDRPPSEVTDGALILGAYRAWGERCAGHLLGDFSFAIWDAPQQTLYCARDHLGIRPFYYYLSRQVFAFASEINPLLTLPGIPRRVNETRVAEFLRLTESVDKRGTFYEDIWRLPPGTWMTVKDGQCRTQSYWALDPTYELPPASDEAYTEQFRALFFEAVRCRLRSAYPVGTILSGGLDSAAVTCVADELKSGSDLPLHTFSAYFTGEHGHDERPFIEAIRAKHPHLISHFMDGGHLDLSGNDVKQIVLNQQEPFWYSFLFVLYALYREAANRGVRVLLDGIDGDSTVATVERPYLTDLLRTGRWGTFAAEVNGSLRRQGLSSRPTAQHWFAAVRYYGLESLVTNPIREQWNKFLGQTQSGTSDLANPDLILRIEPQLTRRGAARKRGRIPAARLAHYKTLEESAFPYHTEMLYRAAAASAVEVRHPFRDKRLVEFCLALPPGQRSHHGESRVILRRALAPVLPQQVSERVGKGMVSHRYLRSLLLNDPNPLADEILANKRLTSYVNHQIMSEIYEGYRSPNESGTLPVWYSASLGLWLHWTSLD